MNATTSNRGIKLLNEYALAVNLSERGPHADLYAETPKAVWAAIAVSEATNGGDRICEARELVLREWWALYRAGIVPQEPPLPEPIEPDEDTP
jgi:hypothetical protein